MPVVSYILIFVVLLMDMPLGLVAWLIFALVVFGCVVFSVGAKKILKSRSAINWPQVDAVVTGCSVGQYIEPHKGYMLTYYYPEIHVNFFYDGSDRVAETYGLVKGDFSSLNKEDAEKILKEYRIDQAVKIYISPCDLQHVALIPLISPVQMKSSWAWLIGGIVIIALAICSAMLYV